MKQAVVLLLAILCLLASCAAPETEPSLTSEPEPPQTNEPNTPTPREVESMSYQKITGDEAAEMMTGDVIVLDVRTLEEYTAGHIANALLLPYDEISGKAAEVLPDMDTTILVYCRTGRRSEIAANALIALGYTAVYDFGGIETDWSGEVIK